MINEDNIRKALKRSGYLLECRVAEFLSSKGYIVEPNFPFPDPVTDKTREIDLIACPVEGGGGLKSKITVRINLNIETINNPLPIAFFANKIWRDGDTILNKLKFITSPVVSEYHEHFVSKIELDENFHLKGWNDFSTQYCTFQKKKGGDEWMAYHPDDLYQTFLKLYHYVSYAEKKWHELLTNNDYKRFFIYLPVLILQGELYKVEVSGQDFNLEKVNCIQFDFGQHCMGMYDSIVIDVITEDYLPEYVTMIKNEEHVLGEKMVQYFIDK